MPQRPGRVTSGIATGAIGPAYGRVLRRWDVRCPTGRNGRKGDPMGQLSGQVAVVTGGGSGIGLASATALARAGASVAVVDIDRASAERAADEVGGMALQADVSDSASWPGIV